MIKRLLLIIIGIIPLACFAATTKTPNPVTSTATNSIPAAAIIQDSTHRFATDSEKSGWNGKTDAARFANYSSRHAADRGAIDASIATKADALATASAIAGRVETWAYTYDMALKLDAARFAGYSSRHATPTGATATIYLGTTAPANPADGTVWINTSGL